MRISLAELAELCGGCSHQNGGHTRGVDTSGKGIFGPLWANAMGACAVPGCPCPRRTRGTRRVEAALAPLTPQAVDRAEELRAAARAAIAAKPCRYGSIPCGATPTRPFIDGALCAAHEPVYIITTAERQQDAHLLNA